MAELLSLTIVDNVVTITDEAIYVVDRTDYVSTTFMNSKKTTGDVHIPVPVGDLATDSSWSFSNLVDSRYKFELVLVPIFDNFIALHDPALISKGTVLFYGGKYYRALNDVIKQSIDLEPPYIFSPLVDYTNWQEITVIYPEDVINSNTSPLDGEATFYSSIEFLYYNNILNNYAQKALEIPKNGNICCSEDINDLRCLRDKYESIEIAAASSEYYKGQVIIESVDTLNCSCSC